MVLGATGFIGGHIAHTALHAGYDVCGLRRDPQSVGHLNHTNITWRTGDLNDGNTVTNVFQGVGVVIHAAGYTPKNDRSVDVHKHVDRAIRQMGNVIDACRQNGVRRIIYTSSLTTIARPPDDEDRLADERDVYISGTIPNSAYYESKIAMENMLINAADDRLEIVILNPTAVFGPGDVHLSMARVLIAAARGWLRFSVPVDINVVDVRDVAQAHITAIKNGRSGERYILGGHNLSMQDALQVVAQILDSPPPTIHIPLGIVVKAVKVFDRFPWLPLSIGNHVRAIGHWQAYNTNKASRELNFNPRPFEETISDAHAWLKEHGYV